MKTIQGTYMTHEKRRSERVFVEDLTFEICDGIKCFAGIIMDVSATGMKLSDIPTNFNPKPQDYVVVINHKNKHYKIKVIPVWKKRHARGAAQDIGFNVVAFKSDWIKFLHDNVPKIEPKDPDAIDPDDVWGNHD